MNQRKKVKKVKIRKIKKRKVFLTLIIIFFIIFLLIQIYNKKIKNIYIIKNNSNNLLKEQYIIDIAEINNYPSSLENSSNVIKAKLEKNKFIKEVNVYKKGLSKVYLEIKENRILFYNNFSNKYILEDRTEISYDDILALYPKLITHIPSVPIFIKDKDIPEDIYINLISSMSEIDNSILNHISEIRYEPNNVDEERFLFTMNDGNYVYVIPSRMYLMNKYLDTIVKFDGKKGTLYLDYGSYFVYE